ncbi:MAG: phosphoglycerate kinase [Saprospirales bacterium]|nr:MAG: phosphoglycerate kinase [Saprospirales bacterium]
MSKIQQIDFNNKKTIIRADLNVPLKNGKITDNSRIVASLPTIQHVINNGSAVILMSHLGRPEKDLNEDGSIKKEKYSLAPVAKELKNLLNTTVLLSSDFGGIDSQTKASELKSGQVLLLENSRFEKGEGKGDEQLASQLAKLADIFINDAFGTAHRAHASTYKIASLFPQDKKAFGFLMDKELEEARKITENPKKPYTVILGGAKVSDKLQLIEKLVPKADHLLIGGGMAYTFIKAKGGQIGKSLCEEDKIDLVLGIIQKAEENNCSIHLPIDTIAADEFKDDANKEVVSTSEIPENLMGLDIGPKTIEKYRKIIAESVTIFWNGPMGVFEMSSFANGTIKVAEAIGNATSKGAYSLIGGGDSVAAVNKFQMGEMMSFLSTGGGAMLTLLEGTPLPAVEAMEK